MHIHGHKDSALPSAYSANYYQCAVIMHNDQPVIIDYTNFYKT